MEYPKNTPLAVELKGLLKQAPLTAEVQEFSQYMADLGRGNVLAIVFYGSTLNPGMSSKTSTPDYYVVVSDYRDFYRAIGKRAWLHGMLNRFCPPNIYRFKASKFTVISMHDLVRETSLNARDVYNMGRFSKRIAIAWAKSEHEADQIATSSLAAMKSALIFSLPLVVDQFDRDTAIRKTLQLSYLGEPRVEAEDKIDKIFRSQTDVYRHYYGSLLNELASEQNWLEKVGEEKYRHLLTDSHLKRTKRFISRSRRRAIYRWPKFLVTVENWADYMAAKIERTQGLEIELTEKERKYPIIYCWKYLWMLKRNKMLK